MKQFKLYVIINPKCDLSTLDFIIKYTIKLSAYQRNKVVFDNSKDL